MSIQGGGTGASAGGRGRLRDGHRWAPTLSTPPLPSAQLSAPPVKLGRLEPLTPRELGRVQAASLPLLDLLGPLRPRRHRHLLLCRDANGYRARTGPSRWPWSAGYVPLDDAAVAALEAQDVNELTRVCFIEITNQAEFEALWKTGLFGAINESTGSLVDDYEEVAIPVEMVPRLRTVVESYAKQRAGGATAARFFSALLEACDLAERSAKPVYFVL